MTPQLIFFISSTGLLILAYFLPKRERSHKITWEMGGFHQIGKGKGKTLSR